MKKNTANTPNEFLSEDAIFHYTKKTIAIENILKDYQFKFSSFRKSNDPYEYNMKIFGAGSWVDGESSEIKVRETQRLGIEYMKDRAYYLSFCRNNFDNREEPKYGWENLRMWSQYGENHSGVCLVLSRKKLLDEIENSFLKSDFDKFDGKVDYQNNLGEYFRRFIMINIEEDDVKNKEPNEIVLDHIKKHIKDILLTKQTDYENENEYRVILLRKNNTISKEYKFSIRNCIIGIIFGDRFPKVYKPTIDKLCSGNEIFYGKMLWSMGYWQYLSWNIF